MNKKKVCYLNKITIIFKILIFLGDENLTPVIHTPIMDDSIMKAENHRRRRRSIY
jgi:hypothetical protein